MRGAGTLRTIIGRPIYGKQKQQQEPDLHEAPPKKQKTRKSSGGLAAGQKSLFNFYSVAAPAATAPAASQEPSGSGDAAEAANSIQHAPPRCKSAPVPLPTTAAQDSSSRLTVAAAAAATGSVINEPDASWSASSQSGSIDARQPGSAGQQRQQSPEACSQQHQQQQQQHKDYQQQQQQQSPVSGPLLVNTRLVGRQHQSAGWPPIAGSELLLVREASNPVDPWSILVCSLDSCNIRRTHGHLPAAVACHLAPLLDRGEAQIQVTLPQTAQSAAGTATTAAAAAAVPPVQRAVSEPPSISRRSGTPPPCADLTAAPGIDHSQPPASDAAADPVDAPAQQQQQQPQPQPLQLQLHVTLLQQAEAPAAALSAVDRAASAGLESLQPGRSSGATLAAAFEHIMSETRQHDFHLLSTQEQSVLQHMQALPGAAKALLLRLLLRKRTWFQLSTLAYADVSQPETAARRLAAVGLLQWDSDPGGDLDSLLQELPVLVLKQVLAGLLPKGHPAVQAAAAAAAGGGSGAPNKAAVISSIQANACRVRLQAAIAAAAGPCVAVTPAAAITFARLQLLYFASPGHDLSMFVAVERGAVSYPSYSIQRMRPVFSSRQQVLDYEAALALAARVDTALEVGDNEEAWQMLQPALTALQAGVHKGIAWDEACAPVPNPLPRQRSAPPAVPAARAPAAAAGEGPQGAGDVCINSDQQSVQRSPNQALRHVPSAPAALGAQSQLKTATASAGATADFAQPLPTEDVGTDLSPQQQHSGTADVQQPAFLPISAVQQHLDSSRPEARADCDNAAAYTGLQAPYGAGAAAAAAAEGPDSPPTGDGSGAVPEVLDLTQAGSSDVSWDMEATGNEEDPAATAAAGAGAALPGAPAVDLQQAHRAPQQRQQQEQSSHSDALQQCVHPVQLSYDQQLLPTAEEAAAAAGAAIDQPPRQDTSAAAVNTEESEPPLFFARFCAGWVHASLGTVGVSLLEKQKRYVDAVELLRLLLGGNACVGRRGDWWTRLAINLEHLGRTEDALEAVEAALADAWVRGGDLLGLQRRYLRLGKPPRRWKRPSWAQSVSWEPPEVVITARPLNNNTGLKSRFYAPDNSLVTVEQLALQHYASDEGGGWQGLHCEGGVWAALFTLLLWDVIYMGVPDVFRSPFQTCPLDLDTDAFYPARRTQLDTQLTRIADGQAGSILTAVWSANAGVMARGVNWQRFTQQQLLEICDCVGGLGLAAVLRLMAEDHAGATGGLPDLLLWRPSDRCAKCVEVKGPRDRLSHQQRFWLAHMANNTMEVEVLKVKEPQPNKRK